MISPGIKLHIPVGNYETPWDYDTPLEYMIPVGKRDIPVSRIPTLGWIMKQIINEKQLSLGHNHMFIQENDVNISHNISGFSKVLNPNVKLGFQWNSRESFGIPADSERVKSTRLVRHNVRNDNTPRDIIHTPVCCQSCWERCQKPAARTWDS